MIDVATTIYYSIHYVFNPQSLRLLSAYPCWQTLYFVSPVDFAFSGS